MRPYRFYAIALLIVAGDQISKWAVLRDLPYGASRSAIAPILYLTHTRNTGGAFSLLQARNAWFVAIAAIAIVALVVAYHRYQRRHLFASAALALALGGAVGNLVDRIRFGYVVDFFDVQWRGVNVWPVFNVADAAITCGIVILAACFVFARDQGSAAQQQTPHSDQPAEPAPSVETPTPNL